MKKLFSIYFLLIFNFFITNLKASPVIAPPFIEGQLISQLGNQMFIVAAATSLAIDNDAIAVFPDFLTKTTDGVPVNYKEIFFRVNTLNTDHAGMINEYHEPFFHYSPIPFQPDMKIIGYFQSEKYFKHNKKKIIELFSPSKKIKNYLSKKYHKIIKHPLSVAIHYRDYTIELPNENFFVDIKHDYYERALAQFPDHALFIVFSNNPSRCKKRFAHMSYNFIFIEGEQYYHDLFLMSMCKHNIICNSTFSWWGAYLNSNPSKKVIAPLQWFNPNFINDDMDLIPEEWIRL